MSRRNFVNGIFVGSGAALLSGALPSSGMAGMLGVSKGPAQVVYRNGIILTVDKGNSTAEAVAVRDGRVLAVGRSSEVSKYIGRNTRVVDLRGKTMIPGFYDAHGHFPNTRHPTSGADLYSPPIGPVRNIEDIVAALRAEKAKVGPHDWIQGTGYDDTLLAEKRHPTRADLDRVSTTQPVAARHVSGHLTAVNSVALALAGITASSQSPEGGLIFKDANGQPTGVLADNAARPLRKLIPPITEAQQREDIRLGSQWYASQGCTTANVSFISPAVLRRLEASVQAGELSIRVMAHSAVESMEENDHVPLKSGRIKVGGVGEDPDDGSLQGYTGYLSKPYYTPFHGDKNYRGFPYRTRAEEASRIMKVIKSGRQMLIHANGDAAIDDVLYAYRKAQEAYPRRDPRNTIIHAQTMREDQLDEAKRLHVIPSFFELHVYYWGDRHRDIFLGPERAARISPERSALDRGMIYTTHTDSPVVPMEPILELWCSVNRITSSGKVLGADQRVPVAAALRAMTINAAYQNYEEKGWGSIEVGKHADMVVLSDNIMKVDPMALKDIKVLATISEGKTVYQQSPGEFDAVS
jgi:hypothetical protein